MSRLRLSHCAAVLAAYLIGSPASGTASVLIFEFEGQLVDDLSTGNPVGSFLGFMSWDAWRYCGWSLNWR